MVNDLSSQLPLYKYVDDCSVSEVVRISELDASKLQQEIDNVTQWSNANNMKLNVKKTKDFIVSFLHNQPSVEPLIVDNQTLEVVNTIKLLGVYLTSDLTWTTHVRHISFKASKRLYALRILKRSGVQPSDLKAVYCSFIRPVLEYACPVWHTSLPKFLTDEFEHIQKRALKIIVPHFSYSESLIDLKLSTLEERRNCYADPFIKTIIVTLPVKFLIYCLNLWIISTDLNIPDLSRFLMHELNAIMIVFYHIAYANGTLFEFLNSYQ